MLTRLLNTMYAYIQTVWRLIVSRQQVSFLYKKACCLRHKCNRRTFASRSRPTRDMHIPIDKTTRLGVILFVIRVYFICLQSSRNTQHTWHFQNQYCTAPTQNIVPLSLIPKHVCAKTIKTGGSCALAFVYQAGANVDVFDLPSAILIVLLLHAYICVRGCSTSGEKGKKRK